MTDAGHRASRLNAARRARDLERVAEETVDVLVVGLGVTGAGAALDAASRGLSVAAIDAHDLAFGTSRWSSKMVHGGLRYLARGQVGVAYESAVERGILLTRTAPHLARAQPYLLPLVPSVSPGQAALAMTGYRLGDALRAAARTPRRVLPGPSRLPASRALEAAPAVRRRGLRGALLSWDGRLVDDARLVVALARTAAWCGARVLTRCRALRLAPGGAEVRDELTGSALTIRARAVVNATGVWAGRLADVRLRPSRGSHLVLRPGVLPLRAGLHVPIPGTVNRFALVLPQPDGRVYVGLTDEPVDGPVPDVPEVPEEDVTALLEVVNGVLEAPLTRADVAGAFAGLRPLLEAPGRTADLSRRHAVLDTGGVVTVVGGKLTTYRRMAEDAVDRALALRGVPAGPSVTASLPLVGAGGTAVAAGVPRRLVERYGSEAREVWELARRFPEEAGLGVTLGELVWAVRCEGALDVDDLLDRRTRLGLVPADRAAALPLAHAALEAALPH
ncbi:glycerol-3-phosphate dehydrogenase/oxidase [Thermoactinospora rubra]|uniref:glycerol-3-phosphate dehydrogenase/oxidase n=1 Tax=Thermoactinospora rubra TaxID=1088767 RepID=UPI000A11A1E3|nr:glycerol-3-phosphate dehydrogenase/oxidase [Thermoactinospora rubra]